VTMVGEAAPPDGGDPSHSFDASKGPLHGRAFFISAGSDDDSITRSDELCGAAQEVAARWQELEVQHWADASSPGFITVDIVRSIDDAPVVFADLTDANPNVYYEVGLAHAMGTPVISLLDKNQRPAFDLAHDRTIQVDIRNGQIHNIAAIRSRIESALHSIAGSGAPATAVAAYQASVKLGQLQAEVRSLREAALPGLLKAREREDPYRWVPAARQGLLRRVQAEELHSGFAIVDLTHGRGEVTRVQTLHGSRRLDIRFHDDTTDSLTVPAEQTELDYFIPPF
jgi:hypothetical protein